MAEPGNYEVESQGGSAEGLRETAWRLWAQLPDELSPERDVKPDNVLPAAKAAKADDEHRLAAWGEWDWQFGPPAERGLAPAEAIALSRRAFLAGHDRAEAGARPWLAAWCAACGAVNTRGSGSDCPADGCVAWLCGDCGGRLLACPACVPPERPALDVEARRHRAFLAWVADTPAPLALADAFMAGAEAELLDALDSGRPAPSWPDHPADVVVFASRVRELLDSGHASDEVWAEVGAAVLARSEGEGSPAVEVAIGCRCEECGWPQAATLGEGCTPGNCSQRPSAKGMA